MARPAAPGAEVTVTESAGVTRISCATLDLDVDTKQGVLTNVCVNGSSVLARMPELCIWRANTDNDGIRAWSGQGRKPLGQWREEGLNEKQTLTRSATVSREGENVTVTLTAVHTGKGSDKTFVHAQTLSVLSTGAIRVDNVVECDTTLPSLPRIGVELQTVPDFEAVAWFGRGPHENHIDRNAGTPVGHYEGTVDEQFVDYVLPQENGSKSDVRWFTVDNGNVGLKFTAEPRFEFSVRHFTDEDLYRSAHTHELEDKRRPETVIHIDHKQRGVGTGSCGPQTFDPYCVAPGTYRFTYTLSAFNV